MAVWHRYGTLSPSQGSGSGSGSGPGSQHGTDLRVGADGRGGHCQSRPFAAWRLWGGCTWAAGVGDWIGHGGRRSRLVAHEEPATLTQAPAAERRTLVRVRVSGLGLGLGCWFGFGLGLGQASWRYRTHRVAASSCCAQPHAPG